MFLPAQSRNSSLNLPFASDTHPFSSHFIAKANLTALRTSKRASKFKLPCAYEKHRVYLGNSSPKPCRLKISQFDTFNVVTDLK